MKKTLYDLLSSKKALVALLGLIIGFGSKYIPGLEHLNTEELAVLLSPVIAYVLGQGMADIGKEAPKAQK
jgi:hypothetical protein